MIMTFISPVTGLQYTTELSDQKAAAYKQAVIEQLQYRAGSLDQARRKAHNDVSVPVELILRQETGEPQYEAARKLVAQFFDPQILPGQSRIRDVRTSGLYI